MKTRFLLFTFSLLLLSLGCNKSNAEKELRIDIGTQFENDLVTIKLDENVVFSDTVSTSPMLGAAKILVFDYPIGKSEISVNVNGIAKTDVFKHKKDRFVYLSFDRASSEIGITYPTEKYQYD